MIVIVESLFPIMISSFSIYLRDDIFFFPLTNSPVKYQHVGIICGQKMPNYKLH